MSEVVKFAKPDHPVADAAGFIRTETAEDILRSLALLRSIDGAAVTMISGAPGIGKTEALLHYERQDRQAAVHISIAKGEGNPFHVAGRILAEFAPTRRAARGWTNCGSWSQATSGRAASCWWTKPRTSISGTSCRAPRGLPSVGWWPHPTGAGLTWHFVAT